MGNCFPLSSKKYPHLLNENAYIEECYYCKKKFNPLYPDILSNGKEKYYRLCTRCRISF